MTERLDLDCEYGYLDADIDSNRDTIRLSARGEYGDLDAEFGVEAAVRLRDWLSERIEEMQ